MRPWSARRIAVALLGAFVLILGVSLFSSRAWAVVYDNTVPGLSQPGHLQLDSRPGPGGALHLSPGAVRYWTIDSSLTTAPVASLVVQLRNGGGRLITRADGLMVGVRSCSTAWTNLRGAPVCEPGASSVWAQQPVASMVDVGSTTPEVDLNGLTNTQGRYLLVSLSLPDSAAARADTTLQGLTATIGLGLTASADAIASPLPPAPSVPVRLAFTGVDLLAPLLTGAGALGLGLVVTGARRVRVPNRSEARP